MIKGPALRVSKENEESEFEDLLVVMYMFAHSCCLPAAVVPTILDLKVRTKYFVEQGGQYVLLVLSDCNCCCNVKQQFIVVKLFKYIAGRWQIKSLYQVT